MHSLVSLLFLNTDIAVPLLFAVASHYISSQDEQAGASEFLSETRPKPRRPSVPGRERATAADSSSAAGAN